MFHINQYNLFEFKIYQIQTRYCINVYLRPHNIKLRKMSNNPFCSFIVDDPEEKNMKTAMESYTFKDTHNGIIPSPYFDFHYYLSEVFKGDYFCEILNRYVDEKFDDLTEPFTKYFNLSFHNVLFYIDITRKNVEKFSILVGGFPIRGIVNRIGKSDDYILYNGILVNTEPFRYNLEEYATIIYMLVDVKSKFQFSEYIQADENYGDMITYEFFPEYLYDGNVSFRFYKKPNKIPMKNREFLFEKSSKNIFSLSDIPKDIVSKSDTLVVKL